jgi:hypothetical protein
MKSIQDFFDVRFPGVGVSREAAFRMLQNVWLTDQTRYNRTASHSLVRNKSLGSGQQVKLSDDQIRNSLSSLRSVGPAVVVKEAPVTRSAAPQRSPTTVAVLSSPPSAPLTPATPSTVSLGSPATGGAQPSPASRSPPLSGSAARQPSPYFSAKQEKRLRDNRLLTWSEFYNLYRAPHLWGPHATGVMIRVSELLRRILLVIAPHSTVPSAQVSTCRTVPACRY